MATTTTANIPALSPARSGSTLAAAVKSSFVDDDALGRSLVIQFTADGSESLQLSRKLRELLPSTATENSSGWSRPAGLIIGPRVDQYSQEEAGLCSSSATPHDNIVHRLVPTGANSLAYDPREEEDDDVARAGKLAAELKLSAASKEEVAGELQNYEPGVIWTSECTAAPQEEEEEEAARDCPPRVDTDNAALLAAGALLDLSSSLVDEGYNTSSIGSSTGNVIESEKPQRKQKTQQGEEVVGILQPETSGTSNDEDEKKLGRGSKKMSADEPPPFGDQQTEKRRRIRTAWVNFEIDMSLAGKIKRSRESQGESKDKGNVDMAAAAQAGKTSVLLLGPAEGRKLGGELGKKNRSSSSSIVMQDIVQETSVLPRPAHRKRYRPIAQLMQETPVVDTVYSSSEDDDDN